MRLPARQCRGRSGAWDAAEADTLRGLLGRLVHGEMCNRSRLPERDLPDLASILLLRGATLVTTVSVRGRSGAFARDRMGA
jgi:hypothetical protein